MSNEQNIPLVGTASYANGDHQEFTSAEEFIKTIREELPYRSTTGFTYRVLTEDAKTRKAVDDLVYNEYGEENPHDLVYYETHPKKNAEKEPPDAAATVSMADVPLYRYPASYAREHDELPAYRSSNKANIACKEAIEAAISSHYYDNRMHPGAVKEVVDQFGYDRTFYVLANTVKQKDWDGRISPDNKDWAMTVTVFENPDAWGEDRNCRFVVDKPHTGLTDLFITQARREYLLSQPLTQEDVCNEAIRLLAKLQEPKEPNSPSGTHFMAQISPDYLARASSKNIDKLLDMIPFKSICFSRIQNLNGIFATISANENRNQPLGQRRPSVRKKLQEAEITPPSPAIKAKEMEL